MNIKPNIYLDIDGVLLANENSAAIGADIFLRYVIKNYDVYWLTTHCHGDATVPVKRFGHLFELKTRELLPKIKATDWQEAKTEAIDFSNPFLWFDDDLYDDERTELLAHNVLDNWIQVKLSANPRQLKDIALNFPEPSDGSVESQWQAMTTKYNFSPVRVQRLRDALESKGIVSPPLVSRKLSRRYGASVALAKEIVERRLAKLSDSYDPKTYNYLGNIPKASHNPMSNWPQPLKRVFATIRLLHRR